MAVLARCMAESPTSLLPPTMPWSTQMSPGEPWRNDGRTLSRPCGPYLALPLPRLHVRFRPWWRWADWSVSLARGRGPEKQIHCATSVSAVGRSFWA